MNLVLDDRVLASAIGRVAAEVDRAMMAGLSEGAELVAAHAQGHHEYTDRSGDLTRSIQAVPAQRAGRSFEAAVVATAEHAASIEGGAAPHGIKPKTGRYLRFKYRGRIVFKKFVYHPGNRAYRFLENAATARVNDVASIVEHHVVAALERNGFDVR